MKKEAFEESLARGTTAEDKVYNYLIQTYSLVQDVRHQVHGEGSGPRLVGTSPPVILPDFNVIDRFKGKYMIDVKFKSSAYPVNGKKYFTVDDYKFEHYKKAVELYGFDDLWMVFVYQDKMYFYDSIDVFPGKHIFDNEYGKKAYLFEVDDTKVRK